MKQRPNTPEPITPEEAWQHPLAHGARELAEEMGQIVWKEDGEGITKRRYPSIVIPDDAESRIAAVPPGQIWRRAFSWMRIWAEQNMPHEEEDVSALRPHVDKAWFALDIIRQLHALETAEEALHVDALVVTAFSLGVTQREMWEIHRIAPDWERGQRNREQTKAGGKATTRAPHQQRWQIVKDKMTANAALSEKSASEHAATERPELGGWETFRKSYRNKERKLGNR